jgi:hypothetical protein
MFGGHNTPSDADVHGLENFIWQEMNGCLISFRSQLSDYKKHAHCLWESGILIRGNLTTCACSCTLFIVRTMATKRNRSKAPFPPHGTFARHVRAIAPISHHRACPGSYGHRTDRHCPLNALNELRAALRQLAISLSDGASLLPSASKAGSYGFRLGHPRQPVRQVSRCRPDCQNHPRRSCAKCAA